MNNIVSANSRKIPLEGDGTPHDCPFSPYNESKSSNLNDIELIEYVKKLFLSTLNRRLQNHTVIDFVVQGK
jgi:hypothetical protein